MVSGFDARRYLTCKSINSKKQADTQSDMDSSAPQPIYLKDYQPPSHLIDTVDLDVTLEPKATRVHSKLTIRPIQPPPIATASSWTEWGCISTG